MRRRKKKPLVIAAVALGLTATFGTEAGWTLMVQLVAWFN